MDYTEQMSKHLKILLGLILVLAAAVRLVGINHGLPYPYQVDEKFLVNHAISFGTGDLNPHVFHWPGTSIMYLLFFEYGLFFAIGWLLGIFPDTTAFAELFITDPSAFYLIGRITIVLIGTFTVYLVFDIGRKMYSERSGLIAAVFFAFSYLAVGIDHFIFPDTPLAFLFTLSMLFFYRIVQDGRYSSYLWSTLIIGLAIATKYNAGALIVPFMVAHFLRVNREQKAWHAYFLDKRLFAGFAMIAAGFAFACPFCILDFDTFFYKGFLWQFGRVGSGSFGADVQNALSYYIFTGLPNSVGVLLTILSISAVLFALIRHSREDILLSVFVLFYFLFIGSWKVGIDKYLLPILPFFIILAGMLTDRIISLFKVSGRKLNMIVAACTLMVIIEPVSMSINNNYLLMQPDTRTQAKEWIESNIIEESRIAIDSGNFDVSKLSPPLSDSIISLQAKMEVLESDFPETWAPMKDKIENYFKIKMKYPPEKGYQLFNIVYSSDGKINKKASLEEFEKQNIEYVVVSSYAYDVYDEPVYRKRNPETAEYYSGFYASLDREYKSIKVFHPLSKEGPGPTIKIYKINY